MATKRIGLSFSAELEAVGLSGLPFAWGDDGRIEFSESMTAQQIADVNAVYDAHDPEARVPLA